MNFQSNLVLIDSTITYNEIKNLKSDSAFITFDYDSHLMLKKNNIEHIISDSFVEKNEFDIIQEKTYDFSAWYDDSVLCNELKHRNVVSK